jgi:riboflavin kinase/FMN adenylyltransferase
LVILWGSSMLIHCSSSTISPNWTKSVVCIGTFDGVHLGHQQLVRRAVELAREHECPSWILTFDQHPMAILNPERCPAAVAGIEANLEMFQAMGICGALVLHFDRQLMETSAEDFFQKIVRDTLKATHIVIGHDFAFGHNRVGTGEWLEPKIETTILEPYLFEGVRVSSSAVRSAISEGRVEDAARFLGRPFSMHGVVVSGEKMGRSIGFPTINLATSLRRAVPPDGVYSGFARTAKGDFLAAIGIGMRPTFEGTTRTIEAYLLDYPGDYLYGTAAEIGFLTRLRADQKFDSVEALVNQMEMDVAQTRTIGTTLDVLNTKD